MKLVLYIILTLIIFVVSKYVSKKHKEIQKKEHKKFLENIRKNWNCIRVKSSDCQIIKFDTLIDEKQIEKEDENYFEWLSKNRKYTKLETQKRTKIVCYVKDDSKIEKKLERTINLDSTIVEVKVRIQDYINIYIPKNIESYEYDDYYIDLEFLEQPINSF